MEIAYEATFLRDLKRVRSKKARHQAQKVIDQVKQSSGLNDIPNLIKLRGYETFYRIRAGNYRVGVEVVDGRVIFVRFLHRKDIYRYFPS